MKSNTIPALNPLSVATRQTRERIFLRGGIFVVIACTLLLTLQFQTIPLPVEAQIMPLTTLLALMALPFVLQKVPISPLLLAVGVFSGFSLIHSCIALIIDMTQGDSAIRFTSWLRQFIALMAGVGMFMVMRFVFGFTSNARIIRYVVLGTLPVLFFALLNIVWGGLGQGWAGTIVKGVRSFIAPLGYTAPLRASGFATEPSTFAAALLTVVLPLIFVMFDKKRNKVGTLLLLFLTVLSFTWTFSISGLLILFCMLVAGALWGPKRRLLSKLGILFVVMLTTAFALFPNNQVFRHLRFFATGKTNVSFTDRFYSTFGPVLTSYSSLTMFGYGLGGTVSHFEEIVPEDVQAEILRAKWKELPNLGTLFGRVFAETGAIGSALFLTILFTGFWEVRKTILHENDPPAKTFLMAARLGLFGAIVSLALVFGSFHMPYLWLWLGIIDARYIDRKEAFTRPAEI